MQPTRIAGGPSRIVPMFAALALTVLPTLLFAADQPVDAAATRDYAVALGFQKKKLYPQAAERWDRFVKAYPNDARVANAHYHIGVCQFQQKQFPQAETTFRDVLNRFAQFTNRDGAQFNLGLVLHNAALVSQKPDDFKKAATEFEQVVAKYGQSKYVPDALFYQADSLYLAGDKPAAVAVYQQLTSGHPTSPLLPQAFYALGTTLQELEKPAEAVVAFQTFLTKFPTDALIHECRLRLGLAFASQKNYPEAEKFFAQAAGVADFPLADFALLQQAQAVFDQNKPPDAAALFESLPQRFAKSEHIGAALLSAGKARYTLKQFPQAATDLSAVVAQKLAQAPEAAYWLGRTEIQLAKPADAVKTLEAALAAYPQSEFVPQTEFARIDAIYELPDRRKETVALYADFAAKRPQHELAADAFYRAALTALELQDFASARKHSDAFLANAAWAKHALMPEVLFIGSEGWLLGEPPDLAKSEVQYRRVIDQFPDTAHVSQARVRVGFCLYSTQKFDPAVAFLTSSVPALKEPALQAEAQLLIGRSHSDAKRPPEAVAAFRAAVQAKPDWERADEVLFLLALDLRRLKDLNAATVELTKLNGQFAASKYRDVTFYQLGTIAVEQKNYDVAVAHFRQVLAGFPQGGSAPPAQYGIGSALFEKNDLEGAANELSKLLSTYPQAAVANDGKYLRGLCYQRLKKFAEAVADLNAFVAAKPGGTNEADARLALALSHVGLQQHPQAIEVLNALLLQAPDYAQADKVNYELAFALLATKQPDKAVQTFEHLATKWPDGPLAGEAWFRVGEFHENAKQLPNAAKAFAAGLQKTKEPKLRESLYYKLGWVQFSQAAYAESVPTLQAQMKEFPQGELVHDAAYVAAESLYRQNKPDQALPLYQQVVAAKAPKYHARALYRSGDCSAIGKQWPASQATFASLIAQFPKFEQLSEARYGLGFALQNQTKLDEARQIYEQVTKETNTETAAKSRFMMGECAFAQKKYDVAVQDFLEAALGYPYDEWRALGHLEAGRCFLELKDPEKAREELETVVKKFPNHARAKDAAQLLANLK